MNSSTAATATTSLSPILPILNAFNHRHHNQHRLAHWWPVFRIFRRTIRSLIDDLTSRRRQDAISPPPRAIWLNKHFISRAYIAFSQLAADNQHAPLGLLLLAILARTHTALTQLLDQPIIPPPSSTTRSNDVNQDKGVAIARQKQPPPTERLKTQSTIQSPSDEQGEKLDRDTIKPSKSKSKEIPSKEKKKKKKVKGDALSSLFGSLA
ncbi:hypothetical protein Trihar35433_10689 [Trichoderma harzianum]|nr:hypothetical protein Trihar35433_10689 [Trichoderma harzianum]